MNSLLITIATVALAAAIVGASGDAGQDAERQLKAAMNTELVDGNLKLAIEQYKKVAGSGNRALAAQALLRMADCYQKLGDREAQAIYGRLVRDYGDQKDAVSVARARLGSTVPDARATGDRSLWTDQKADGFGTISPDGRLLTYTDWETGSLMLRDLPTGTDQRLVSGSWSEGWTQFSAISKDGKQLAYQWMDGRVPDNARRYELRIAKLQGSGISDSRRLFDNEDVRGAAPYDWSPDGRWIAVHVSRKDLTGQIGLVGVQDGSLRILKSVDWKGPTKIFFSPDSQSIAYDLAATDNTNERHVYIMALDGSRETAAVVHPSQNVIMGWSPDGRHLLFASDRSGSYGLWGLPVAGGKAVGTATLLKPDVSSSWSLGVTGSGTMYVWKYASPVYIQATSIDLATGKLGGGPPATFQRFISSRGRPDWSADGKHLAYQSCAPLGGGPCTLWIRSMATGEIREVPTKLQYFFFPRWSPDGRELLVRGNDLKGRQGLYRIDAQTGDVTVVATPYPGGDGMPQWSPDGRRVYYQRSSVIIERELGSGVERELGRLPAAPGDYVISPDGRDVAYLQTDPSGSQGIFVMPITGGAPRALLQVSAPERLLWKIDWTADGHALAVAKERGASGRQELWLVPVGKGKPRKLDIDVDKWVIRDGLRVDRSGKLIAFVAAAGKQGLEIRALENFLPAQATAKPSAKR